MTKERAINLLKNAAAYIDGIVGSNDSYETLINSVGFTESEIDEVVLEESENSGDYEDGVYCEDITGVLGMMFASDMRDVPDEAVFHLSEAYAICAKQLGQTAGDKR